MQNGTAGIQNGTHGLDFSRMGGWGSVRVDGWQNALSKYGTKLDSTMATTFEPDLYSPTDLGRMWSSDSLMAAFVEKPARAMLRRGFSILTGDRPRDANVDAYLEHLELVHFLRRAVEYKRAYGGGAVYLGFDDGCDPAMPVPDGARLIWLGNYDTQELRVNGPFDWDRNPLSAGYGKPLMWHATLPFGSFLRIHPSRLLIFQGRTVSNRDRFDRLGWGWSPLARFAQKVADLDQAFRSLLNHLKDLSMGVLGMHDLAGLLSADGNGRVMDRAIAWNMSRSAAGIGIRDAEKETYERVSASIAGFPEAIDRLMIYVASAAGMPVTVLFGREPTGLNATGASDIRNWYDELEGMQGEDLLAPIRCVARHVLGLRSRPLDLSTAAGDIAACRVKFRSLWQPTELEQSQLSYQEMQTVTGYLGAGALDPDEATKMLVDRGYPIDLEARRRLSAASSRPAAPIPAPATGGGAPGAHHNQYTAPGGGVRV